MIKHSTIYSIPVCVEKRVYLGAIGENAATDTWWVQWNPCRFLSNISAQTETLPWGAIRYMHYYTEGKAYPTQDPHPPTLEII